MLKENLFFILLIPSVLFSQRSWKVGLSISPDYCYRSTNNHQFKKTDYAKMGYSTGVSTSFQISNKLEILFGLTYSKQTILRSSLEKGEKPITDYYEQKFNTSFLLIPIRFSLVLGHDNWGIVSSIGISNGVSLKEKNLYINYLPDNTEQKREHFNFNVYPNYTLNVELYFGIRYKFYNSEIRILPSASYSIIGKQDYTSSKFSPFVAGISFVYFYQL